jgi:predicted acyltransferase
MWATLRIHTVYKDGLEPVLIKKSFIYRTCTKAKGLPLIPKGIMSTLSAIVEVDLRIRCRQIIYRTKSKVPETYPPGTESNFGPYQMLSGLFVAGVAMLFTGYCWDKFFPVNKKIWTSSFTICTSGLATITIATMIYLIEYKNRRGWLTKFFDVFGKNALFVFALSAFLPRTLALIRIPDHLDDEGKMVYIAPWGWLYQRVLIHIPGDPRIGSLAYAICVILFMWFICWWLDKRISILRCDHNSCKTHWHFIVSYPSKFATRFLFISASPLFKEKRTPCSAHC